MKSRRIRMRSAELHHRWLDRRRGPSLIRSLQRDRNDSRSPLRGAKENEQRLGTLTTIGGVLGKLPAWMFARAPLSSRPPEVARSAAPPLVARRLSAAARPAAPTATAVTTNTPMIPTDDKLDTERLRRLHAQIRQLLDEGRLHEAYRLNEEARVLARLIHSEARRRAA